MDFYQRIADVLNRRESTTAIEFAGATWDWTQVGAFCRALEALLREASIPRDATVGLVAKTSASHAMSLAGMVSERRSVAMVYSMQSDEALSADIGRLGAAAVLADESRWTDRLVTAAIEAGSLPVALPATLDQMPHVVDTRTPKPRTAAPLASESIHVLSSGTTGTPKRIAIPMNALIRLVEGVTLGNKGKTDSETAIACLPLSGIGGLMVVLGSLYKGDSLCILERFDATAWADAVRRYRIQSTGMVPAMVRALVDSNIPKDWLASLKIIFGGSGALEPELQEQFEARFGIPILWGYGATEFAGTLATWTPDLRREFGARKPGSVGRPLPGIQVRIIDEASGAEASTGTRGFLTARIPALGDGWMRTTDIASLDEDGFLFIHGRGDGAINRGGFKVIPDIVASALRLHPAVLEAAVIPRKDPRLGEVPVACVELRDAESALVTAASLEEFLRARLPAYAIPVETIFFGRLPRTGSLKVSTGRLKELLQSVPANAGSSPAGSA